MDFSKYLIKKAVWWGNGNFKVFDHDGTLQFRTKSKIFEFRKKIRLIPVESTDEYLIEAENAWMNKFLIRRGNDVLSRLKKKAVLTDGRMQVESNVMGFIEIKTNVWRTNYTFLKEAEEIARLSVRSMGSGESGLAIKPGCEDVEIISLAILMLYMKESGTI